MQQVKFHFRYRPDSLLLKIGIYDESSVRSVEMFLIIYFMVSVSLSATFLKHARYI